MSVKKTIEKSFKWSVKMLTIELDTEKTHK